MKDTKKEILEALSMVREVARCAYREEPIVGPYSGCSLRDVIDETDRIRADAVRGWMRAQVILDYNERLGTREACERWRELEKQLEDAANVRIDPRLTETEKAQGARIAELERQLEDERWMHAACLTIVEGASGIKSVEEITQPVSEAMRQCFRVRTELDAAKARIAELEAEVERLKSKAVQLLDYINELHSAAPGVTHTASAKEVWEMVLGKANKYDALRKKFPFLPGE